MIGVHLLNGTNFPEWKEYLLFQLGLMELDLMELDLCFQVDFAPAKPTEESSAYAKVQYENWERSNRLSLSFMLQHVPRDIRGPVTSDTLATAYLEMIEQQFVGFDKAKVGVLIQRFTFMHYTGKGNIREYIVAM